MKKAFIILSSGILLISSVSITGCGGGGDKAATEEKKESAAVVEQTNPEVAAGLELIGKSDCLTCHKVNEAAIGPAYSAVAERYKDNPVGRDSLAYKIIKGGAGNWGVVAMTPHPTLSEEDAKKMVTYVMSVKPE